MASKPFRFLVSNLPFEKTASEIRAPLKERLSKLGEVVGLIAVRKDVGKRKCSAFVSFSRLHGNWQKIRTGIDIFGRRVFFKALGGARVKLLVTGFPPEKSSRQVRAALEVELRRYGMICRIVVEGEEPRMKAFASFSYVDPERMKELRRVGFTLFEKRVKVCCLKPTIIFVGSISGLEKEDISDYFGRFGEIVDVSLQSNASYADGNSTQHAFVTFSEEVDLKMLVGKHYVECKEVEVNLHISGRDYSNSRILFVGGVGRLAGHELRSYFEQFGAVEKISLMPRRGFAYVSFEDEETAGKVLQVQSHNVKGCVIKVEKARKFNFEKAKKAILISKLGQLDESSILKYFGNECGNISELILKKDHSGEAFAFVSFATKKGQLKALSKVTHMVEETEVQVKEFQPCGEFC